MPDFQRVRSILKIASPAPMRRLAKRAIPSRTKQWLRQAHARGRQNAEFRADASRYSRYADSGETESPRRTIVHLEAQLTRDYHRVEKGLALAQPQRPFGADVMTRLNALIPFARKHNPDAAYLVAAESARDALLSWNSGGGVDPTIAPVADAADRCPDIGRFFESRHSVRDFSDEPVSRAQLHRAVELAAFSPSVCNRQPWKVRLFFGEDVARVLAFQNGNRGFTHRIPALALVSVELGHFAGAGERNQAWIEGGIFSASLVWALHSIGLSSCMLNLSVTTDVADGLRAAVEMPASEVPIMMIAVGHGRAGHRVARSPRRPASHLIIGSLPVGRIEP